MRASACAESASPPVTTCIRFSRTSTKLVTEARSPSLGTFTRLKEALFARLTFLTVRNTVYKGIYDRYKPIKPTNDLTHRQKGVISAIAGSFGALASNMFECAMVRKIADLGRADKFQRPNLYHNPTAGLGVNVLRAAVLNGIIIWPYDVMKEKMWISFGDTMINIPVAVFCATLVGTVTTFVFDNLKTRMQCSYPDKSLNRLNYANSMEAAVKAFSHEGAYTFFAGFYPMFLKMFFYSLSVI